MRNTRIGEHTHAERAFTEAEREMKTLKGKKEKKSRSVFRVEAIT